MDIKRSDLVRMVAEEVQRALYEFSHGDGEPKAKKKKAKGGRPETKDASDEPSKKGPGRPKGSKNKDAPPPGDAAADADLDAELPDEEPVEDPVAKGDGTYDDDDALPGDDEMAADTADADTDAQDALDDDGDAGTDIEGEVADQIRGRVVDGLTLEPESDMLPGSREVVLTFADSPDVLRIMVDNVGNIVFYLNGQPYDLP